MEQPRPLTYPSLKCVFPYMNANWRFLKTHHFPSLRNLQQSTSLKIDVLKLDDTSFTVNNMKYSFGTVRENSNEIGKENQRRYMLNYDGEAFPYDVDQDGWEDINEVFVPGDIKIVNHRSLLRQGMLVPYFKHNLCWILMSIYYLPNEKQKELMQAMRTVNGIKLRDTVRQLTTNFFGGTVTHYVKHIEIKACRGILRLPQGIKFKVQELKVQNNANEVIKAILPILDKSSFPLRKLSIEVESSQDPVFQNEILRTSNSLNIEIHRYSLGSWSNVFVSLTNTEIVLSGWIPSDDEIKTLVSNWILNPRIVGSKFCQVRKSPKVLKHIARMKNHIRLLNRDIPCRVSTRFAFCDAYKLTATTELYIYSDMVRGRKPMRIVMEVLPIGM